MAEEFLYFDGSLIAGEKSYKSMSYRNNLRHCHKKDS